MDHIASLHYADDLQFLAENGKNMTEFIPVPSSDHVAALLADKVKLSFLSGW